MESEDAAAAWFRIEQVGEPSFRPGGLVQEGQRLAVRRQRVRQSVAVLARLGLHAGECVTGRLGLDYPSRLLVDIQQVIGGAVAGYQPELAHRHTSGRRQVERVDILHGPSGLLEQGVNLYSGALLRGHGYLISRGTQH